MGFLLLWSGILRMLPLNFFLIVSPAFFLFCRQPPLCSSPQLNTNLLCSVIKWVDCFKFTDRVWKEQEDRPLNSLKNLRSFINTAVAHNEKGPTRWEVCFKQLKRFHRRCSSFAERFLTSTVLPPTWCISLMRQLFKVHRSSETTLSWWRLHHF